MFSKSLEFMTCWSKQQDFFSKEDSEAKAKNSKMSGGGGGQKQIGE